MHIIKTEKLFIFGGAYGNLQATRAILDKATSLGFHTSEIVFTGDAVAYCADPEETAQLICNSGIHAIKGNCEEAISTNADDCGCGFEEGSACDVLSDQWYSYCKSKISNETSNWMASLAENIAFDINGYKMLAVHATPTSNNQFVFPSTLSHTILENDASKGFDGFITGHSGIPFIGKIGKALWLNSGAAGMPANDGTHRVWYATIELRSDILIMQTHALEYDYQSAAASMKKNDLENGYMACISSGIWPSHDVLPELERSETGTELTPQKKAQPIAPL